MAGRPDRELRDAWVALQVARPMASPERLKEIDREEYLIRREWDENLERKKRGEDTDGFAEQTARKVITTLAKFAGIELDIPR